MRYSYQYMSARKNKRKSTGWGGAREGAGRPAILRNAKLMAVRIDGADFASLERLARKHDVPLSDYMRHLIKRHLRGARRAMGRPPHRGRG